MRTSLKKTQKEMVGQQKLDGECAVLNTTLGLELAAFYALPDDDKESVTIRVAKNMTGAPDSLIHT